MTATLLYSKALLLKVKFIDQQHQHHLGVCYKVRISVPTPDLLNQNLHFNKMSRKFMCTLKLEKHLSRGPLICDPL